MTDMPELHTRLLAAVIALGSPYPLILTRGYTVRAHRLVNRPSQYLDIVTENPAPMADIAAMVSRSRPPAATRPAIAQHSWEPVCQPRPAEPHHAYSWER